MAQQEFEFVEIIAKVAFRAGGKTVKKGASFKCTKETAKQLVAVGKAGYPAKEEKAADDGKKATASTAKKSEPAKS